MAPPTTTDPWIAFRKLRPQAKARLFCFPNAGGSAIAYREWTTEMPPEVEVLPVQLPGRERRLREKPFNQMEPLIDALMAALTPYLDRPFAIFGHSMGAGIGYAWALRLRQEQDLTPVHLSVSAREAPHLPADEELLYKLNDADLGQRVGEMGGTPAEVLAHPELMEILLPVFRADFELNDTYSRTEQPSLDCPMTAFGGTADGEVTRDDLAAWAEVTSGTFKLHMFEGDHFYLNEHRGTLISMLAEELRRRID